MRGAGVTEFRAHQRPASLGIRRTGIATPTVADIILKWGEAYLVGRGIPSAISIDPDAVGLFVGLRRLHVGKGGLDFGLRGFAAKNAADQSASPVSRRGSCTDAGQQRSGQFLNKRTVQHVERLLGDRGLIANGRMGIGAGKVKGAEGAG